MCIRDSNEAATALRLATALADEANKYIDETKPWVIAKQEGADAELRSVCTQGLNLFRVLAAALKPVLPRTAAEAEAFLSAPVETWADAVSYTHLDVYKRQGVCMDGSSR